MHRRDVVNACLLLAVFGLSLFIYLSGDTDRQETGVVLGDSTVAEAQAPRLGLFVEGLIAKRRGYGAANCQFLAAEYMDGAERSWEGELIWNDSKDYKLSMDGGSQVYLVGRGNIYAVREGGTRENLGTIDDKGAGSAKYSDIQNYVFEDFLGDLAENPDGGKLLGEDMVDGIKYFILESRLSLGNPIREVTRKIWVSEEGMLLKAEIDDKTQDYEVYDSTGTAVQESGHKRHIDIEVKNRIFF